MSILYLLPSRFVRTSLAYISLRNIPRGPGAKVSNNELLNDLMATGGTGNGWKKCPFFLGDVRVVQGESKLLKGCFICGLNMLDFLNSEN